MAGKTPIKATTIAPTVGMAALMTPTLAFSLTLLIGTEYTPLQSPEFVADTEFVADLTARAIRRTVPADSPNDTGGRRPYAPREEDGVEPGGRRISDPRGRCHLARERPGRGDRCDAVRRRTAHRR